MASRKKFKVNFDACVSISFCVATLLIFLLDSFAIKNFSLLQNIFSAPGAKGAQTAFNFSSPSDYARLIFFVFGNKSFLQVLLSLAFILPYGALMEERYGSPAVALMMAICAVVSGVLNACLVPQSLSGAACIATMLILLSSITSIAKNEIPLSNLLALVLCLSGNLYLTLSQGGPKSLAITSVFVQLAGALCASMAGFLTAPKTRRNGSASQSSSTSPAKSASDRIKEIDEASPRKKTFWPTKKADDETTVIGSISI